MRYLSIIVFHFVLLGNIYSQTGSLLGYQKITNYMGGLSNTLDLDDRFGAGIATIGDVNGDGIIDIAASAFGDDDGGNNKGAVYILFMDTNKTVSSYQKISALSGGLSSYVTLDVGDLFGAGLSAAGDFNGDNIPDIIVAGQRDDDGGTDKGSVYIILLNSNGTVKGAHKISASTGYGTGGINIYSGANFGSEIANLGDIDGNGVNDFAVGAYFDSETGSQTGAVYVLKMKANGTVKSYFKIKQGISNFNTYIADYDRFGVSVGALTDRNNDNIPDLAVGSYYYGSSNEGAVYMIFLDTNGVKGYTKYTNNSGGMPNNSVSGNFGISVREIHDLNEDGINDILVGADYGSYNNYLLFINNLNSVDSFITYPQSLFSLSGSQLGAAVDYLGDINQDGDHEIVTCGPNYNGFMGIVVVATLKSEFNANPQYGNLTCSNSSDAFIKLHPTGGTPPYSYLWSNNSTLDSIGGLSSGTFTVTITDNINKSRTRSFTITSPPAVNLAHTNNFSICSGNQATLTAAAYGGNGGPFSYHWSHGLSNAASHQITHTSSQTYMVYASDQAGCHSDTAAIVVTVNPVPSVNASGLNVAYCQNDNTPVALSGSPSGGLFSGSGVSGSTFTPSNASAGSIDVVYSYSNSFGCSNSDTLSTTVYAVPQIQMSSIASSYCINHSPFTLSASPSGGTFSINGTNSTVFNPGSLGLGTYKIKYDITTAQGCSNSDSVITYVNPITTANFYGLSSAYCEDSGPSTLSGTPSGGSFLPHSGLSGTSFNPAIAGVGQHPISYTYTNFYGCTDTATISTTVNPITALSVSSAQSMYCSNDTMALITVSPNGGTLSGPGINNSTRTFNPTLAGLGNKNIIYTFTNPYGCTSKDTLVLTVNSPASLYFVGLGNAYCLNHESIILSASPSGGTFVGNGVNGSHYSPALAGVGQSTVSYMYDNGCKDTIHQNISIHGLPSVSIGGLNTDYCEDASSVSLTGSPSGGTFMGAGISGSSFNPATAGVGAKNISYRSPADANGCIDTATAQTTIHALPTISFGSMSSNQCIDGNSVSLSASPSGGTFSGSGVTGTSFNPASAGSGINRVFYSYTDVNNCSNVDSFAFVVHDLPSVSFTPGQSCANITAMNLSASPSGGSFSGANVSGNNFFPINAGAGSHQVVYAFTDANGCSNSDTGTIVVNALPNINFLVTQSDFCVDGSSMSLSASPSGGSFSGNGIVGTNFNPASAGVGAHDLIYAFTDGNLCSNSDTQQVVVHALPSVSITNTSLDICQQNTSVALQANPSGGSFSGNGVNGNTLNPSLLGLGNTNVFYSYTDAYNCSNSDTATFVVHGTPQVLFTDSFACFNQSPMVLQASPAGGIFSGSGVSNGAFNPINTGLGGHKLYYSFTDSYGCNSLDSATFTVHPAANISFSLSANDLCIDANSLSLNASPAGGTFSGLGVSGSTFNPATAGVGNHQILYSYTNAFNCSSTDTQLISVHALPNIDLSLVNSQRCYSTIADSLTGLPLGGTWSGAGVINNLFIGAVAGLGNHNLIYSFIDSLGCSNIDTLQLTVHPLPQSSFNGLDLHYCLNDAVDTLVGLPAGGIFSGAGMMGSGFSPAQAGVGNHMIYYSFTDSNNCSNSASVSTQVHALPLANAGRDTLIPCNSNGVQLGDVLQSGHSYLWLPSNGLNSTNIANPIANPTHSTTYVMTIKNLISNCKNYDTVVVSLPSPPPINISADTAICLNDSALLRASGAPTILWSNNQLGDSIWVSPTATQIFTATIIDSNACQNWDTVEVEVYPLPQIQVFSSDSMNLAGYDSLVLHAGSWNHVLWSTGDTTEKIVIKPADAWQTLYLTVTDSNSCSATDSVYLLIESIDELAQAIGLKVYPNPATDLLWIKFSRNTHVIAIRLLDSHGKLIQSQMINRSTQMEKLSVSALSKGLYYIQVVGAEKNVSLPVVIE